jgi:hypothetical protein
MSTPRTASTESLEVTLTRLDGRLGALEAQMITLQEQRQTEQKERRKESKELNATLLKICIQLNTQKTQTKITWALLAMVASGIFGMALAMF